MTNVKRDDIYTGLEIAIIGMTGRFPGARNIDEYWENLKNGVESISFFSDEELEEVGVSPRLLRDPNYVKAHGVLEDKECFDSSFFGYTPIEGELMDPQIRIFHEASWEALEDAGYDPSSYNGAIGVYAGASDSFFWRALGTLKGMGEHLGAFATHLLNNGMLLSTRVSHRLDLKGPSITMFNACSTSLVTIHLACRALLLGECDIALAGAVSIPTHSKSGYIYEEGLILSQDGHCRTFDTKSNGTVYGEGVGIIVLKRLKEAIEDGNTIRAVIKGSAVNNDGIDKSSFAAPGKNRMADVIRSALKLAEVDPEDISYVEAHGTATALGDTIEFNALTQAFDSDKRHFCRIGSVKTNIGHLDVTSGVAGVIKTVLAFEDKLIPPSLHFETPNPNIDFENSPFQVNTELHPWENEYPLRAGVNGFGIGGTNAFVVLEEPPNIDVSQISSPSREWKLILHSAKTESALDQATENLAEYFKKNPGINLADAAYTLQVGRKTFQYRRMLVCSNMNDVVEGLSTTDSRKLKTFFTQNDERDVVFMFSGIGSQYVNMGVELYQKEPLFRKEMDRCFEILNTLVDYDIKEILYPNEHIPSFGHPSLYQHNPASGNPSPAAPTTHSSHDILEESVTRNVQLITNADRIKEMEVAQPVIFAFEYALARLLMKWGIKPEAMIGYSLGEYAAACIAGVFSLGDVVELIVYRGKLVKEVPPGIMLSVPISEKELQPLLTGFLSAYSGDGSGSDSAISLAIDNGPSCVVAGPVETIEAFEKYMKEKRYLCIRIQTSHAIHSIMMEPILKKFEDKVEQMVLNEPQIPYVSNVTGNWITSEEATNPRYWAKHLRETVRFEDGIKRLVEQSDSIFIEIGPGRDLSSLMVRHIDKNSDLHVLNLIRPSEKDISDIYFLLTKIGQLWLYRKKIDWPEFYPGEKRRRIPLPPYPFQRQRYNVEGNLDEVASKRLGGRAAFGRKSDLADWFYIPSWKRSVLPIHVEWEDLETSNWLVFMDELDWGFKLVEQLENNGQNIITVRKGQMWKKVSDREYIIDPGEANHYEILFNELKEYGKFPTTVIHLWNITKNDRAELGIEFVEKTQDLGYYSLLNIAQSMGRLNITDEIRVMVVSNNVQEVFGEDRLCPEKAPVIGTVKGIPKEYANIHLRSIDVVLPDPESIQEEKLVGLLLEEFITESIEPVVAYRDNHRWVEIYEPVRMENATDKNKKSRLKEKGVYLITGGLGGIGLALAEYLAKEVVGVKLILFKRSEFLPKDQWKQWLNNHDEEDSTSQKIRKIQHLEELGAEVFIGCSEMDDLEKMQELIGQAQELFGPINGVIHSAGIPDGAMIQVRTKENSECIFSPKVNGTLVLDTILKDVDLDFFILCSSIDSVIAATGQVGYCAANIFLNAYAKYNAHRGGPFTVSINWPRWQSLGMAVIAENLHKELKGFDLTGGLVIEEGKDAFRRILENRFPQVAVYSSDLMTSVERDHAAGTDAFMEEFETANISKNLYQRPELTNEYVAPGNEIEEKMVEIWQNLFGFEQVGVQDDFFELGGDSLKVVITISKIHRDMNVEIPISVFFNTPNIEALTNYISHAEESAYSSLEPVEEKEYYALSSIQRRLYVLQQMERENAGYNETKIVRVEGKLDKTKLEETFKKLIERHEIYRTSMQLIEGKPVQKIHDPQEIEFSIEYDETSEEQSKELAENFVKPFDLNKAPLFRIGLIRIGHEKHILIIDTHHIITDKTSDGLYVKELLALYEGKELYPLTLQYRDYVEWQNSEMQKAVTDSQKEYWLKAFDEEIPVLSLPFDYPRPEIQSFEGNGVKFAMEKQEIEALNALALKENVTLYMVLLSIYNIFLSKLSGQDDIIVGTPVAGRRHAELRELLGIFINTLVLRNYPNEEKTYKAFLKEIRENTLKSFDNQDYPFEDLIDQVEVNRDMSRNPLFDVMFALQNTEERPEKLLEVEIPDFKLFPFSYETLISKFDLILEVEEARDNLIFSFQYCTKLFRKETIERFISYFKNIVSSILRDGEQKLSEIEFITEEERQRLLYEFNDTAAEYLKDKTIHDLFKEQAARVSDRIAVVSQDGTGTMSITYEELNERSNRLAGLLREKGVKAGTTVGILVQRSIEMMIGLMGILKAGGAYLPIDTGYPQERIDYMLVHSSANVLLTSRTLHNLSERTPFEKEIIYLESYKRRGASPSKPDLTASPENHAYVIYTSGSTGRPKGVIIGHRAVVNFIKGITDVVPFKEDDIILSLTTICFDIFVLETFLPLTKGTKVVIGSSEEQLDPEVACRAMERENVTIFQSTPSRLQLMISKENTSRALKRLSYLLVGGEAFPPVLLEKVRNITEGRIYNVYGPTETTVWSTIKDVTGKKALNIGKPIVNTQIYILARFGTLQPVGVPGELCIGGDGMAVGYINNPGLTLEKFTKNPYPSPTPAARGDSTIYKTGDLARWLPDGDIEFLDRFDHQVKVRGYRIELGEIESQLLNHEKIKDAVVVAKEEEGGDKFLCAYIVDAGESSEQEAESVSVAELREILSQTLPDYMIPSYFVHLEEIPLTPNGKIDRKVLPAPKIQAGEDYIAPRNFVEEKLAEIWSEVLEIEKDVIGINDNFFELGGHSLRATISISKIHQEFNVRVPIAEVFKTPEISRLAVYIDNATESIYEMITPAEVKDYYPQSSAQKRLFFLDQFDHIGTTYNFPGVRILRKEIGKDRFGNTVKALIARHEILRTSFELIENIAVQRVYQTVDFEIEEIQIHQKDIEEVTKDFIRPFDLAKPPLLRVGFGILPNGEYLLLFDLHHIINDGISMDILFDEFAKLYNGEKLPPLKFHYKDFSSWQNNLFITGKIKEQEKYWLNLYSDWREIPKLDLPTDFLRPAIFSFEGDDYYFQLSQEDSLRFKRISSENNVTIFMNLLAAFNLLLFKYTGEEDIIIGCDIAGRRHAGLENIIGMFVNELPMRNYPNGNESYVEFLKEVKENSISAFENQDFQFEELVDRLNLERDPSRNPLFDVEFVLQNIERSTAKVEDVSMALYDFKNKTAKFDLALDATEVGDDIQFRFQYYIGLFKRKTIESLAGRFLNIIREVSNNPEVLLSDIEMMSEKEKQQILFEFNNTKKNVPIDKCYPQLFEQQVEMTPDKIAVRYKDESISYRQLDEKSNQLASYLYYEKNIRPNDRVAIWMDRSIYFVTTILGIMKAGGAYVPIDPIFPEERIKRIINDAEIGVTISQEKYTRSLNRLQWESPPLHTFLCIDSKNNDSLKKDEEMDLKSAEELWNYIVETAVDDITEGGWLTSYTGEPFTREEMDEYGDNILKKLTPLLHKNMRVLEIGCASGITMYRIAPRVGFYYGTDISRETIERNRQRLIKDEYDHDNIHLESLPAHEIDKITESNFDLIIINSVIQSFNGHNYLRNVLRKAVNLVGEKAYLFIGDVMDQDLKENLKQEMVDFKQANRENNYKTKVDWSSELFISRAFFEDLTVEIPEIVKVEFSDKIYAIENELTKFRYDTFLTIDKTSNLKGRNKIERKRKHKYQDGLEELNAFHSKKVVVPANPDDLAYVIYTSGTTGLPKGVLIHQQGMINHMYAKIDDFSITWDDIIAQTASASFDISVWQFLAGLLVGASTIIIDKETVLEGKAFLKVLQEEKITILESVPSLMTAFLEMIEGEEDNELKYLRWMIPTGEALTVPLVRQWYKQYQGIKLMNAYGPTEASDDVTHYVIEEVPSKDQPTIPIGKPLQNLHIYILDNNLTLCPVGVRGEICVAGMGVGKGYWKDEEKTKKSFIPNPFLKDIGESDYATIYKTGDIGYFRADGNVECLGRIDLQVKIRGNRIEVEEIENRLLCSDEIKEAVVTVKEGGGDSKYLCAYIVSDREIEIAALKEYLLQELPDYMVPTDFMQIERIPLTPNGKIDRKALPEPGIMPEAHYNPPRNEVEKKLVEIWENLLEKEPIGIDDDFFMIGGDSIKTIQIVSRMKAAGYKLEIRDIFQYPSISQLALRVKIGTQKPLEETSVPPMALHNLTPEEMEVINAVVNEHIKDIYPLSPMQEGMLYHSLYDYSTSIYVRQVSYRLQGDLDIVRVEKSLNELVKRHDVLRTVFIHEGIQQPVQVVMAERKVDFLYKDIREITGRDKKEVFIREFKLKDRIRLFDLSKEVLMRIIVIQLEDTEFEFIWIHHHILMDGWCSGVLIAEYFEIYNSYLENRPYDLSAVTPYRTFIQWLEKKDKNESKNYWKKYLHGYDQLASIHRTHPLKASASEGAYQLEGLSIRFEKDETEQIYQLAGKNRVTLNTLIQTTWGIVLAKFNGRKDVVFGVVVSGRPHEIEGIESMIGLFINTIPVRIRYNANTKFNDLIRNAQENAVDSEPHHYYSLAEIQAETPLKRDLLDHILVAEDFPVKQKIERALEKRNQYSTQRMPKLSNEEGFTYGNYDFGITIFPGEQLHIILDYNSVVIERELVQRIEGYFKNVLKQILNNEAIFIDQITLLSEGEIYRIRVGIQSAKEDLQIEFDV